MESNEKLCPACGGILSPGAKFCPSCGTKLEEEIKPELTLEDQPSIPETETPSPVLTIEPEPMQEEASKAPEIPAPVEEPKEEKKEETPAATATSQTSTWYTPGSPNPAPASEAPKAPPHGKICPNCGAPVSESALFCNHCGASLNQPAAAPAPSACSCCGAPLEPGAAFCARCGTQVPSQPAGESAPFVAPQLEYRGAPIYPQKSNQGTISLVLGIIGILFALLLPIIAYPLGIIGIILAVKARKNNEPRSTAGLVLSIIALVVAAINSILGILLALGNYYWYYY